MEARRWRARRERTRRSARVRRDARPVAFRSSPSPRRSWSSTTSADVAKLIQRLFERRGYRILVASDGKEGLERVTKEQPDLVFLDIGLPTMDGFEVCRRLQADGKTRHIPIMMMSAENLSVADAEAGLSTWAPSSSSSNPSWAKSWSTTSNAFCQARPRPTARHDDHHARESAVARSSSLCSCPRSAWRVRQLTGRAAPAGEGDVGRGGHRDGHAKAQLVRRRRLPRLGQARGVQGAGRGGGGSAVRAPPGRPRAEPVAGAKSGEGAGLRSLSI